MVLFQEKDKFFIPVSKTAFEHGVELGLKVYKDKLNLKGKTKKGASELQADIYGFVAESCVCEYFKEPLPGFTPHLNDSYDLMLGGKRVDVKKVSFQARDGNPKITIKKKAYYNKTEIEAYLFVTFEGALEQKLIGESGHRIFIPIPELSKLWLLGWIETTKIEQVARSYFYRNQDGTPQDESWELSLKDLKPVKELIG